MRSFCLDKKIFKGCEAQYNNQNGRIMEKRFNLIPENVSKRILGKKDKTKQI